MFTVRPFSRPSKPDQTFRVHLSPASLIVLKLRAGDLCLLKSADTASESNRYAIAWTASEKIQDSVVQTSKSLQDIYGFKLGDKISISRVDKSLQTALQVTLCDTTPSASSLPSEDISHWQWYLTKVLSSKYDVVASSQTLEIQLHDDNREFQVITIEGSDSNIARITNFTKFEISDFIQNNTANRPLLIKGRTVGGLLPQIQQIQHVIDLFESKPAYLPPFYHPTQGILIYGAKGTGKSLLIDEIAQCPWKRVVKWNSNDGRPPNISDRPCLIILQDMQRLNPSSDYADRSSNAISSVRVLFEKIKGQQVLVVGEVRHPNHVHESLRSIGRFEKEIELPIPTENDRHQILQKIRGTWDQPTDHFLVEAAARTHGYVGADLFALMRVATESSMRRTVKSSSELPTSNEAEDSDKSNLSAHPTKQEPAQILSDGEANEKAVTPAMIEYSEVDLNIALSSVRPTALQEVFLETPKVRWSDIGGQHEIKQRLQNAVEWPLKYADRMKVLNLKPKKGMLLYGPPGCSKTMLVKALATEAGLNFLAVKGAELISMYVGESERAVREVFRKARAASPSIIFFDEIDSIASRTKTELNVLTTLLNEMDGFEELKNVLVVAATNKPESIDPALMRPGRLDNVLYIGPPDVETRKEIFQSWFDKSSVQADASELAEMTDGFSGAEVVGICQTAGELAMRDVRNHITRDDFLKAIAETPKAITREILEDFKKWNASRI